MIIVINYSVNLCIKINTSFLNHKINKIYSIDLFFVAFISLISFENT